jgi:hypothetical protein
MSDVTILGLDFLQPASEFHRPLRGLLRKRRRVLVWSKLSLAKQSLVLFRFVRMSLYMSISRYKRLVPPQGEVILSTVIRWGVALSIGRLTCMELTLKL